MDVLPIAPFATGRPTITGGGDLAMKTTSIEKAVPVHLIVKFG
jgi:hypothetical protein